MITIKDLISDLKFEDVYSEYSKHYDTVHKKIVENVFYTLLKTAPSANDCNMVLFIKAFKENSQGDDELVDTFDCDDKSVFFDVWGIGDDYDGVYSIASSPYKELLSYYVSNETLSRFSSSQIISHILWAIDW